ncbi:MAG: TIGR00266 family protein [Firmicutes bacterium]|nr:TIGR00266 family protein [Bacillota bacterium]
MKYQIFGTVMPMIEIELQRGETVYSQSGAMQWMDEAILMQTEMRGGFLGAMKRTFTGESMFVVNFTAERDGAKVAFGHTYPGQILTFDLTDKALICQQRSFLCASTTIDYDLYFQKRLGVGFFGGEGFIMQKFRGSGLLVIEMDGEVVEKELAPGERIRVSTGSVGAFEESVTMDIQPVRGFKNMFLGGEGLFLTTLTGPGRVWLQTMPVQDMVGEISKYLPKSVRSND